MRMEKTMYEYAMDFESRLRERDMEEADLQIDFHIEDDAPVVDIFAELGKKGYIDSYRLENVDITEFEEDIYDAWMEAFEDHFEGKVEKYEQVE